MDAIDAQTTISRIDKVFVDRDGVDPAMALRRRQGRGLDIVIGSDASNSFGLQLAVLTAVNLGVKCFSGNVTVHAPAAVWEAPCLPSVVVAATLRGAAEQLGARWGAPAAPPARRYLLLGDAAADQNAIRVTFDGWIAIAGPASDVVRRAERAYCPPACIVAAAIGVSEIFAEFAAISVAATRRVAGLSLWRPDLPIEHRDALGESIGEAPLAIGVFGLGHLGQAYLWTWAALRFADPQAGTILLCDDDSVEKENVETGALLSDAAISHPKTRIAAAWLEQRGFTTRLLERRVDENFRRTSNEPLLTLSGFDDNQPRQWLARAGFVRMFDSGLGGEATNFDTVAYRGWPNPRTLNELWPIETASGRSAREVRNQARARGNAAYQSLRTDDCGRILLAGKSVAVPFVGAVAAGLVVAEALKAGVGISGFDEIRLRVCALGSILPQSSPTSHPPGMLRGIPTHHLLADGSPLPRAA